MSHSSLVAKPTKKGPRKARVKVSPIAELKSVLTRPGDIRSDIEFQNDVNALLATVSRMTNFGPAGDPLGPEEPTVPHAIVATTESPVRHRPARRAGDPR